MNESLLNRQMSKKLTEIGFLDGKIKCEYSSKNTPKDSTMSAPWLLVDIGAQFQPLSFFCYNFAFNTIDVCGSYSISSIPKYDPWLYMINDYTGTSVTVYYPKKSERKKGEVVDVIFLGCYVKYKFKWVDGLKGLFQDQIIPLLNAESEYVKISNIVRY